MKVNRLELLKREIMLETLASSDSLERLMKRYLSDEALAEIKRQAGILGSNFRQIKRGSEAVVNGSYKNATFSDRIWGLIQKDLQAELEKLLFRAMIQGKHPSKIAQELKKLFDVTVNQAQRLARTELARVQTEVQRKSYKDSGINKFVFIRELDACPICKSVSTDPIKLSDFEVGVNTAPIHPNCRCSTAPYFDREEFEEYLKGKGL
jgi:SPP1 gp7 family putative phage head morphogenesis protein